MKRDKTLFDEKGISEEQYEASLASLEQAKLAVEQAKKSRDIARINYNYCFAKAPFKGMVVSTPSQLGQFVTTGTPIARIVDTEHLFVTIGVTYSDLINIKKKDNGSVELIFPDNSKGEGSIIGIAHAPDKNTALYSVKIGIKKAGKSQIFPGTSVKVAIAAQRYKESFEVERSFLNLKDETYYIFIAEGNKAIEKEVVLESDNSSSFVVSLKDKSKKEFRIITTGQEALKDGQRIEIME